MKILSNEDWDIHCDIMKEQNKRIDILEKEKDEQIQIILTYEKVCELISAHSNYQIYAIMNKASKNGAISRHGLETVIVLIDRRRKVFTENLRSRPLSLNSITSFNGGELAIYAINPEMYHNLKHETSLSSKCGIPYIEISVDYTEVETTIRIDEFHSRFTFSDYRGNGYGSMLLDSLVGFLLKNDKKQSPSMPIRLIGMLSSEDIKDDNDVYIRNRFYKNKGFNLVGMNENDENGRIEAYIEEIKTKANEINSMS
ncbi:MAG: hypothetical protein WBK46_06490 [Ruminococcus flavefaciens]